VLVDVVVAVSSDVIPLVEDQGLEAGPLARLLSDDPHSCSTSTNGSPTREAFRIEKH